MTETQAPVGPSAVFAARVREARDRAGLSQQQLVDRLAEFGYAIDRTTLAKLERSERRTELDRLFAVAVALDVAPVNLLVPLDDEAPVFVTPNTARDAGVVRAWVRGLIPLPGSNYNLAEMPEAEMRSLIRRQLTQGWDPLAKALARENLDAEVERIAREIRTPKEET